MKLLAFALFLATTVPACSQDEGAALIVKFTHAWSAGDPKALSELFEPDADFVSPFGNVAHGCAAIEVFYANAFAHGYAGSLGTGDAVSTRALTPDIMLLDARFRISGARLPDGVLRPDENGIVFAVLHKGAEGWKIAALRENEGAKDFVPFPPK